MGFSHVEKILILAKTYPSPSAQYVETSCVAGLTQSGSMIRLYPVPFRLIEEERQFKKWQWINVRVEKATKDHRPESHKLYVDTIDCIDVISPKKGWSDRWAWLDKIPTFHSIEALDAARLEDGISLALIKPKRVLGLEVVNARNKDWTDEEREKLVREHMQGDLFAEAEARRQIKELKKIPFDFYYRFICETAAGDVECKHKLVDWEVGMLFWNCIRSHRAEWEAPFRKKLEEQLLSKDLMFLVGNQHRFQNQWLIISLVYPPEREQDDGPQGSLF